MAKVITETAIGAAAIASSFIPGIGQATSAALFNMGMSMAFTGAMTGIAELLQGNQGGMSVGTTSPIGAWTYIYGTRKIGGIKIFEESNNSQGTSNNKELHRVYALAAHPCQIGGGFELHIDGKQVLMNPSGSGYASFSPTQWSSNISTIQRTSGVVTVVFTSGLSGFGGQNLHLWNVHDNTMNGTWIVTQPNSLDPNTYTFVCGGADTGVLYGGNAQSCYPDYKDKIYLEFLDGNHTSTFAGLLASGTNWSASDLCLGRTLAYVRMGYDANVFPSSIPNVSFVIQGKNNIYDPRHDTYGYTTNAALCIADFMCLPYTQGGFGLTMGTDISATQLSWAANICDSLVTLAAGGTAPAYTCNAIIQLTETRGSILQKMLTSCAGRLSYQGGQFSIFPGAWVTPTLQLTEADLMGPISWKPRMSVRDACNAVKGTYCSPENDWQTGDIPAYMSDALHGFVSDLWLAEDRGERIFRDVNFPCTVTSAEAQRLAKIEMMRSRYQGRGTIRCSMKAYQAVALDIIQLTHPRYTWLNKNLEVLSSRFTLNPSGEVNGVELDVAETDPAIYNWTATEQLTPQGYKQPTNVGVMVCSRPEGVLVYSGPGTVISGVTYPSTITTGADGRIQNSLYVAWTAPNDANVVSGGHLEIQWQQNGAPIWTAWGKLDPSSTHSFIAPVSDGVAYNVQVRAVNCAGVPSPWVLVGPVTVSNALSTIVYSGVDVAPAGTLTAQGLLAGGAQITVFTFAATVGSASVGCTPSPAVITGLNQSQNYYVYYIDPTFAGGTITPIATQNTADFLDRAGYFLIGQIVTPSYSPRYSPSTYSDIGSNTSTNPAAAYDSNITTDAIVTGIWWTSATVDPYTHLPVFSYLNASGNCIWSGFPNIVTSSVKTLNVVASASVNSATAATCYIGATVAGTGCGLVTLTATTAETTYTLTIPSGTNLSTISVNASASVAVGTSSTSPSSGTCTIQGFEIFIQ